MVRLVATLVFILAAATANAERYVVPASGNVYYLERFGAGQAHEIIGTTDTARALAALPLGGNLTDPQTGYRITRLSDCAAWRPADADRYAKAGISKYLFGATNGYSTYSNESCVLPDGRVFAVLYEVTGDRGFLVQIKPEYKFIAAMGYVGESANVRWRRDVGNYDKLVFDGQWDSMGWLKQFSVDALPSFATQDVSGATLLASYPGINMDSHAGQSARYRACYTSGSTQLYDFAAGRFVAKKSPARGHDVSPLGNWWIYKDDDKSFALFDTATSSIRRYAPVVKSAGHIGWCVNAQGDECLYYMDNGTDVMNVYNPRTDTALKTFGTSAIDYNYHGGCMTVPGWMFVTTYAGSDTSKWHYVQMMMIRIADGLIWRIGSGYQYGGTKHAENFAAPNPDCTAIQFSANAFGATYLDGYRMELPERWAEDIEALIPSGAVPVVTPTPTPTPTPQPTVTPTPTPTIDERLKAIEDRLRALENAEYYIPIPRRMYSTHTLENHYDYYNGRIGGAILCPSSPLTIERVN